MAELTPKQTQASQDGQPQVVRRVFDSYLAFTNNSISSHSWSQYYADINGVKTEIVHDGDRACAYFVSSILRIFNLIELVHMTVPSVIADMKKSDWYQIESARVGAVIVYDSIKIKNKSFPHIGICVSDNKVVSNSDKTGTPIEHDLAMTNPDGSERTVTGYYWHDQLEQHRG